MGKLINEEEFLKSNIDQQIERAASEYTRFLDSTPTFVTYYQRNTVNSIYDKGLENVEKEVGKDSPNMFNKIENFPLYGIQDISLSLSREDLGMDTSYTGEGVIIPNTIKPYPEDFFTIDYIGEIYLFKVTGINNDAIKSKPFYKVEFSFFKKLNDAREVDNQVSDEYTVIFNNIGTEDRSILKRSDFFVLDYIDRIYEGLYKSFLRYFFDKKLNVITFEIDGIKLYNRHLNKFIMDTQLLKKDMEYMDSIYLVDVLQDDITFYEMYRKSIYFALQKCDVSELEGEFVYPMPINDIHTPFAHYSIKYNTVNFVNDNTDQTLELFTQGFIGRIKIDQIFRDDNHPVENMIIDYLYNRLDLTEDIMKKINDISFYPDKFSFIFIPLIMFIFKDFRNKLLRTN